ncbi:MAG TPA: alpha/beta hydrolase [Methylovirgula sp.]|nr:alpha/beta hydrolase [Methylovirgula sp.]
MAFQLASSARRVLSLLFGLSLLSGCATTSLTDLPSGFFGQSAEAPNHLLAFVVSTRKDEQGPGANEMRADGADYSLQILSVPPHHKIGQIERPMWGAADPNQHFTEVSRRDLDEQSFRNELATNISGRIGSNRDILLYVHGFNTGYDDARFRLAQVVADGRFGGVPVLFTWPASNNLLRYEAARESATASRDALATLLKDLGEVPDVGRIHILAHSMGTWLVMEALREEAIAGNPDLGGKLGLVMLAAPDIDLSVFREQLAKLDPSHVSVLVSASDRALSLSETLAGDRPRVGALDPRRPADRAALARLGVKVYDLSGESTGIIGHDTYADAPDVVRSIGAQIGRSRVQDADVQAVLGSRPVSTDVTAQPLAPAGTPVPAPTGAAQPASASGAPGVAGAAVPSATVPASPTPAAPTPDQPQPVPVQ